MGSPRLSTASTTSSESPQLTDTETLRGGTPSMMLHGLDTTTIFEWCKKFRDNEVYSDNDPPKVKSRFIDVHEMLQTLSPSYPWESVMVPIGEWMGADARSGSLANVFPNLANFNRSKHII